MPDVTLDLGNQYIGSAYSPQVAITETATGHEIEFTFADSEHPGQTKTEGFEVPSYSDEEAEREAAEAQRQAYEAQRIAAEDARKAAESARAAAESSRVSAENERRGYEQGRQYAETARQQAEAARSAAESARAEAESNRQSSEQARRDAEAARVQSEAARQRDTAAAISAAQEATGAANTAATAANDAASAANTAAGRANTAATAANDAASAANSAAGSANSAASAANTAAQAADTAREAMQDDLAAMQDELDLKADSDGYYTMLTAGAADNLTARGDGVTASFLHRTTAGSASVPDEGEASVRSIKGRTLGWNQHRTPSAGGNAGTVNGITWAKNADGSVTVSGTATDVANIVFKSVSANEIPVGHKILIKGACPDGGSRTTYGSGFAGLRTDFGAGGIWTSTISTATTFRFVVPSGVTVPESTIWPQFFDLTVMFGAGNEPATVEEFEALYPEPYYPYDAGSLLPVQMEGIETVGFNQWDEEWELGRFNTTTGVNEVSNNQIRAKNLIPVIAGQTYYVKCTDNYMWVMPYDTSGNVMPGVNLNNSSQTAGNMTKIVQNKHILTIPSGCGYVRFYMTTDYGITYNHDICINLSWSGYRDGEYEAYWSEQRVIAAISENFPNGMRSAGTVYDELTETAAITRVGAVDLGTLTWTYYASLGTFYTTLTDRLVSASAEAISAKYGSALTTASAQMTTDQTMYLNPSNATVHVKDTTYGTDAAAFKAAMSGVMLHYALATPTVTPIDPPLNLSYRFADFGTERVMVPTGEMSAPPTMDVAYGLNAVDTLRTLPTEYISKASDASFTAALGAFLNATITRTWDETTQRYDYTITANGE